MTYAQPADEWDFLPTDDEPEVEVQRAAEVAALHVEAAEAMTPARDPGRADVALDGEAAGPPQLFFEDEQPETPERRPEPDTDHEPDLEDLLESQHYAFTPDAD